MKKVESNILDEVRENDKKDNYRTYQFLIKEGHELNSYLMKLMYAANNLYNVTNFYIRQIWTGAKIEDTKLLHPLQKEILDVVKTNIPIINKHYTQKFESLINKDIQDAKVLNGKNKRKLTRFNVPNKEKSFPSYELLDGVFKTSKNIDYKSLPSHVNQGVMKNVYNNWTSYFESIKKYKEYPSNFTGRPKIPKYKSKGATHSIVFSNQVCKIKKDKNGKSYLRFPKTKLQFNLSKHLLKKLNNSSLVEVRVQKYYNDIQLEVVLKMDIQVDMIPDDKIKNVMGIDLGVNNLATCISNNNMHPTIINGRALKSINQYYNKRRAQMYSDLRMGKSPTEGPFSSKNLELLDKRRQLQIKDYMHKATKQILELAKKHEIHKVLIGYNKDFQTSVAIGKKNTQNFVNIPFGMFVSLLEYKLRSCGIHLEKVEESYTSKSSFIDKDKIPTYDKNSNEKYKFSGKRVSRGLYVTKNGITINADVNGACNILRKHFDAKLEIPHKLLSDVVKINIPKGKSRTITTLSKMLNNKEMLFI